VSDNFILFKQKFKYSTIFKLQNFRIHKNALCNSRVTSCLRTDGQSSFNCCFSGVRMRLIWLIQT